MKSAAASFIPSFLLRYDLLRVARQPQSEAGSQRKQPKETDQSIRARRLRQLARRLLTRCAAPLRLTRGAALVLPRRACHLVIGWTRAIVCHGGRWARRGRVVQIALAVQTRSRRGVCGLTGISRFFRVVLRVLVCIRVRGRR